jgi:hypothetical protein
MRAGDKWYFTKYDEIDGSFYNWYSIMKKEFFQSLMEKYQSDDDK